MRHESLARRMAEIKGYDFTGYDNSKDGRDSPIYFVPHDTIVGTEFARSHRIHSQDDLFGAVVPHWYVATKAIAHDLIDRRATRPAGWVYGFKTSLGDDVLPGYTAFSVADVQKAAQELLQYGPIRLKDAFGVGGKGQIVVRNDRELETALTQIGDPSSPRWCVVVELNLEQITTYSIGQIHLGGITVSYWGTQRTTKDNSGKTAYGGSDLTLVRGGFEEVAAIAPDEAAKRAIQVGSTFDRVALQHYPQMLASRRNYDVGYGVDAGGTTRCGMLDQSWRIGGTSGVEVEAVRLFLKRPDVRVIRGSSCNEYGNKATAPHGAHVHFQGVDHQVGPILMYTVIEVVK